MMKEEKRPTSFFLFPIIAVTKKRDVSPIPREDGVLHERQNRVLGREEHHHKNHRLKRYHHFQESEKDSFIKNTSTERGQHSGKGEERLEGGRAKTREQFQREICPVRVLG